MKNRTIPRLALFAGTPEENAEINNAALPPESSAIQMRLLTAGLLRLTRKGDIPMDRFKFGSHYHPCPIDGELVCIAGSIVDRKNNIIAWRLRRNNDGELVIRIFRDLKDSERLLEAQDLLLLAHA